MTADRHAVLTLLAFALFRRAEGERGNAINVL
jgi:hypothetical protein